MTARRIPRALIVLACAASCLLAAGAAGAATKPNILFFLVDDQRNDTLGCAGHKIIKTPIVDSLAARGVRFDTMLYEGYQVPPFYDSLLGKLIVADENREAAIGRLETALAGLTIGGLKTTKVLHQHLAGDADVRAGRFHTQFLEAWLAANPISSD